MTGWARAPRPADFPVTGLQCRAGLADGFPVDGIRNIFPFLGGPDKDDRASNRRRGGRIATSGLTSNRGDIVDLSITGCRIATRLPWKEGDRRKITLRGSSMSVELEGRCVWVRKEGMLRYTIGLHFEPFSDEQSFGLHELVRNYGARLRHEVSEAA